MDLAHSPRRLKVTSESTPSNSITQISKCIMTKFITNIAPGILLAVGFANAHASVVIDVQQVGSNVVASGSGSLNLTNLTYGGTAKSAGFVWAGFPFGSAMNVGSTNLVDVSYYSGLTGPGSFGFGGRFIANSGSGDLFAIIANSGVYVVNTYASGGALLANSQWDNSTLASLGLTNGSYVWTWGSGRNADSFTLNIGDIQVSTVPEPTSVALVGLGIAGLLLVRKGKQD